MNQAATRAALKRTSKNGSTRTPKVPSRLGRTLAPQARNLEQQKTDFTAEGSPPPGKVDTMPPVTEDALTKEVSPVFDIASAVNTQTHKPAPSHKAH